MKREAIFDDLQDDDISTRDVSKVERINEKYVGAPRMGI